MEKQNNENGNCSFMSCLTCHSKDCYTGEMARKYGRKGYEEVIKILNDVQDDFE